MVVFRRPAPACRAPRKKMAASRRRLPPPPRTRTRTRRSPAVERRPRQARGARWRWGLAPRGSARAGQRPRAGRRPRRRWALSRYAWRRVWPAPTTACPSRRRPVTVSHARQAVVIRTTAHHWEAIVGITLQTWNWPTSVDSLLLNCGDLCGTWSPVRFFRSLPVLVGVLRRV